MTVRTQSCREALTALLDDPGARSTEELRAARLHVARCPECASALDDEGAADRVLEALRRHRPSPSLVLRVVLALVATAQLVIAIPWLFGSSLIPHQDVATAHLTRDGAFGLAIAVLGLVVVWRPRYAVTALLVGLVVFVAQSATSLFDEQSQSVTVGFELTHLLVFAVLGLVGVVSSTRRAPRVGPARRSVFMRSL